MQGRLLVWIRTLPDCSRSKGFRHLFCSALYHPYTKLDLPSASEHIVMSGPQSTLVYLRARRAADAFAVGEIILPEHPHAAAA
ncbi:predicted protein [Histoplasma capsulatum G186AR]|uniref:Uncharacterized protein n=1 Tax=Ajellomyces capsulatus (strain G186AR / H82 / ATCC MYA-2454 / RMSCC 2432) TaxID=447093 RepID=C0NGQ0_AJECG|nr:uncharacterized protein HCBG_02522 [Histoplasma capsulatum G186AR]EEH08985.1 predicted protein [Histoplasma capsulatum G186AR]